MISLGTIKNFVQEKNVLLVGNSDRITIKNNSKVIDSYEVVVRMNHAVPQEKLGSKTDIWLCSFNNVGKQVEEMEKFSPRYTIRLNENEFINDGIKERLYVWPTRDHDIFETSLGSLPSTGVMAIHFFLNFCAPKSLTIIGYDCFDTKSFYNTKKLAHLYHGIDNEKQYVTRLEKSGKLIWIKV